MTKAQLSRRNCGFWQLIYREEFSNRAEAVRRERRNKSWKSRQAIKPTRH
ncbi:MAG: hypothetical protein ACE10I_05975 [Candidatus Acidiferrales bacterium]